MPTTSEKLAAFRRAAAEIETEVAFLINALSAKDGQVTILRRQIDNDTAEIARLNELLGKMDAAAVSDETDRNRRNWTWVALALMVLGGSLAFGAMWRARG